MNTDKRRVECVWCLGAAEAKVVGRCDSCSRSLSTGEDSVHEEACVSKVYAVLAYRTYSGKVHDLG